MSLFQALVLLLFDEGRGRKEGDRVADRDRDRDRGDERDSDSDAGRHKQDKHASDKAQSSPTSIAHPSGTGTLLPRGC